MNIMCTSKSTLLFPCDKLLPFLPAIAPSQLHMFLKKKPLSLLSVVNLCVAFGRSTGACTASLGLKTWRKPIPPFPDTTKCQEVLIYEREFMSPSFPCTCCNFRKPDLLQGWWIQSQFLWVHMCNSSALRENSFAIVSYQLWPLPSFCPFFYSSLSYRRGSVIYMRHFGQRTSQVPYFVHSNQLWVSVWITIERKFSDEGWRCTNL